MFQKVDDDERETELQCNCCASCGRQDTTKFEQKMVMDALLILAEEVEKDGSICHYKNKGYFARPSGTWAANVQTKLCDTCMVEFKDDRKVAAPPALKTISTLDLNLSDSESVDEEERDLSSCPLCYPSKTILPLPPLQSSIRQQQRFYREIKIPYNPPSKSWLRKTCKRLKLPLCCYVFKNAISSNNITHCEPTLTASVWGDGHSGYQSLSYLITGRLFNYHLFRILISDTILQNSDKNFENLDGFKNAKRKTEMKKNADYFVNSVEEWMSEIDLAAAAYLLQCNIALWERNGYWSLYNSLTFEKGFSIQHDAIVDQPTILLNNSFCEHNFFNPVINVGQRAERIEDRDVVMEEQQNLDIAEDMDIVENTNDVAELTKNMRELSLLFTEHPGNTDTLDLSSLSIDVGTFL
uniref:Uncharacterized protein n=1 Tax=Panagrolaimus sp. PS1159 TaxID=55785 RepID=A0AC35G270_9BILA